MWQPSLRRARSRLDTCFDWWAGDSRHVEWAGVVCRVALGDGAFPALNSNPGQRSRDDLGLSSLDQVRPFKAVAGAGQKAEVLQATPASLALQAVSYNVLPERCGFC